MRIGPAFLQTFASQVVQSAASIATAILIARGLGPAGQGRYALFAAVVGLVSTLGAAGQFEGHVLTSAGERSKGRVLLARSVVQVVAAMMVVALGQALWRRWLSLEVEGALASLVMLVLVGEMLALLFRGINLGQHSITAYNVATLVQRVVYFMLVAAIAATGGLRIDAVLGAWLVAVAANATVSGIWIWKRSDAVLSWATVREGWRGSMQRGLRALLTIGLTLLLLRADVYMIGPMLGLEAVGQISVAYTFAEYLWYIPSILASILFAAVAASRGPETVAKICRASRTTVALLTPIGVGLAIVGSWVVPLIYGRAYVQAGTLFVLLLPGMLAVSLHLVIDSYFAGSGFPRISYLAAAGAVALKVVLNLILVPRMSLAGAATATSVVYISLLLVKVIAFGRETHVSFASMCRPTLTDVTNNLAVARSWVRRLRYALADAGSRR